MAYRAAILNFSKGELSPELEARFDLDAYQAGLRRALNVKIRRTGGVSKRMGTRFVAPALSASSKMLPFQFSDEQAYALEFGSLKMRPIALGGAVLETGLKVTGITKAANALVTCAYHGYDVGDQVYFNSILGMTQINDRFLTVMTVPTSNTFTVNFNSLNAGTFTGDTGGQVNTSAPPDPAPPPAPPPAVDPPPTTTPPPVGTGGSGGYVGSDPDASGPVDPVDGWGENPPNTSIP